MMKRRTFPWSMVLLLAIVAGSAQGCFGFGGPGGKQVATGSNGQQVTVNQSTFKGKFYLTINHNLYAISGDGTSKELINSGLVYDPAVSPDGKWVAFIQKSKQDSDLAVVSTSGGPMRILRSGSGRFYNNSGFIHNTYVWYAQPQWSADGSTLLFLSDLEKENWYRQIGIDASFLDMQVFSVPFNNPLATPTDIAYATFGDGGNRDASYRPGHPDQVMYTHYTYDAQTRTQQVIQLFMEDSTAIATHPGVYYPGTPGGGYDPGIAITPPGDQVIEPAFSPDGNSIAYIRRDNDNQSSLSIMPVPPGTITQTPNNPATEKLALQAYEQSSHLLSQQYIEQPAWSPDGRQLAYIAYNGGNFDLWVANVNRNAKNGKYSISGNPIQVTTGGIDSICRPAWVN